MQGRILKGIGSFYEVLTPQGTVTCRPRGKFRLEGISPLPGDYVRISLAGSKDGRLDEILPRKNLFIRPPVANIDLLVIVASETVPVSDPYILDRLASVAHLRQCQVVFALNKWDIAPAERLFRIYAHAGYEAVPTSAVSGLGRGQLEKAISGKVAAFAGNSGVGKSSLIRMLCPQLELPVGEVSEKLGRGRHTTRHVELYPFMGGWLADSPGFSAFDPNHMDDFTEVIFPEFERFSENCRFKDCRHVGEAGCAVLEAVEEGEIEQSRYRSYKRLCDELSQRVKKNGAGKKN